MHHHEEPRSRNPSVDELRFKLSFMMWLCNDFEQMGLSDSIIWEFMSVHNINTRLLYPPTYVLCAPMHSSQNLEYRTPPQFHEATWSLITNSHAPINNLSLPRNRLPRPRETEVASTKSWWPTPLRFWENDLLDHHWPITPGCMKTCGRRNSLFMLAPFLGASRALSISFSLSLVNQLVNVNVIYTCSTSYSPTRSCTNSTLHIKQPAYLYIHVSNVTEPKRWTDSIHPRTLRRRPAS